MRYDSVSSISRASSQSSRQKDQEIPQRLGSVSRSSQIVKTGVGCRNRRLDLINIRNAKNITITANCTRVSRNESDGFHAIRHHAGGGVQLEAEHGDTQPLSGARLRRLRHANEIECSQIGRRLLRGLRQPPGDYRRRGNGERQGPFPSGGVRVLRRGGQSSSLPVISLSRRRINSRSHNQRILGMSFIYFGIDVHCQRVFWRHSPKDMNR